MLSAGTRAPSISLPDIDTGAIVTDPWTDGSVILAFFKVSCPVCQMVAPKIAAMVESGARVVAIGQDPDDVLRTFRSERGQAAPTLMEAEPYEVSAAYDLDAVPTVFLVDSDGMITEAVGGWNRDSWNRLSEAAGGSVISTPEDGLRPFRPG